MDGLKRLETTGVKQPVIIMYVTFFDILLLIILYLIPLLLDC